MECLEKLMSINQQTLSNTTGVNEINALYSQRNKAQILKKKLK